MRFATETSYSGPETGPTVIRHLPLASALRLRQVWRREHDGDAVLAAFQALETAPKFDSTPCHQLVCAILITRGFRLRF